MGRALRRLGWSYGEIRDLIPVPKGTLSNWCRDIRLSDEAVQAIKDRAGSRVGVPRDTQRKRHAEIDRIRSDARAEVRDIAKSCGLGRVVRRRPLTPLFSSRLGFRF